MDGVEGLEIIKKHIKSPQYYDGFKVRFIVEYNHDPIRFQTLREINMELNIHLSLSYKGGRS